MRSGHITRGRRVAFMVALVVAGEAIFGLPFVVARVFRPTLLDVFGITNLELGTAFSVYGVVAMLCYFPGGPLADRFSPRLLMSIALLTTAVGGIFYATIPSLSALRFLFAFWGFSSILLFWSAMIRGTRKWGGELSQGQAFGLLDGGRGLLAAALASGTVFIFSMLLPAEAQDATLAQRTMALQQVIWIFTGMTTIAAILVWICIPNQDDGPAEEASQRASLNQVLQICRNPAVWLQGIIVITAYTGYKGMDNLGLYARDVFLFDDVKAAGISTLSFWIRPVAALGAGLIGDRFGGAKAISACFGLMIISYATIAMGWLSPNMPWALFMFVVVTGAAVFGLRGLYFSIFAQAKVPAALTGTAAGLVSVIGYTPDIFMGPLNGYLTDTYPGAIGHQYFYAALALFASLGLVTTWLFQRITQR